MNAGKVYLEIIVNIGKMKTLYRAVFAGFALIGGGTTQLAAAQTGAAWSGPNLDWQQQISQTHGLISTNVEAPDQAEVGPTGTFSIRVPLVSVPGRGDQPFDVSLSYTPGVKVTQEASWVGLGWQLEFGSISRDHLVSMDEAIETSTTQSQGVTDTHGLENFRDSYTITSPAGGGRILQFSTNGQPQIGPYRFELEEYRPWDISYDEVAHRFVVVADDGTKYIYGFGLKGIASNIAVVNSAYPFPQPQSDPYVQWLLTAVLSSDYVDAGGDALDPLDSPSPGIDNSGNWVAIQYRYSSSESRHLFYYRTGREARPGSGPSPVNLYEVAYPYRVVTPTHIAEFSTEEEESNPITQYQETTWPGNSYQPSFPAEQVPSESDRKRRLSTVELFSYSGVGSNPTGNAVLEAHLDYESGNEQLAERSTLKSVQQVSGSVSMPPYTFTYYGYRPDALQVNFSSAKGLSYGSPRSSGRVGADGWYNGRSGWGVDNDENGLQTDGELWNLKTVTYPGGGSSTFTYESNRYYPGLGSFNPNALWGAGTRVTSQSVRDGMTNPVIYNYTYGTRPSTGSGGDGIGRYYLDPLVNFWIRNPETYTDWTQWLRPVIQQQNSSHIMYEWVRATLPDGGTTTTYYSSSRLYDQHIPAGNSATDIYDITLKQRGFPITREHRSSVNGLVVRSEQFVYNESVRSVQSITASGYPAYFSIVPTSSAVTTTTYDALGQNGVSLTATTFYDGYGRRVKVADTNSDGTQRIVETAYAASTYPGMELANMYNQPYRTTTSRVDLAPTVRGVQPLSNIEARMWTTYSDKDGAWRPRESWVWVGNGSDDDTTAPTTPSTSETETVRTARFTDYNRFGALTSLEDARGGITNYFFGDNLNNRSNLATGLRHAYITAVERVLPSGSLWNESDYDAARRLVTTTTDPNGQSTSPSYDDAGRPTVSRDALGNVTATYEYGYSRLAASGWLFNPDSPNWTRETRYRSVGSTDPIVTTTYTDGLGRAIQAQIREGASDIVSTSQYDALGRPWRAWRPYLANTVHAYDLNFASRASSAYGGIANPYVETLYQTDPLSRTSEVIPVGLARPSQISYVYGTDSGNRWVSTLLNNEENRQMVSVTDLFGNPVRTRSIAREFTLHPQQRTAEAYAPQGPTSQQATFAPETDQYVYYSVAMSRTGTNSSGDFRIFVQGQPNVPLVNYICTYVTCNQFETDSLLVAGGQTYVMQSVVYATGGGATASVEGSLSFGALAGTVTEVAETQTTFDIQGHATRVVAPEGQVSTFVYDPRGLIVRAVEPDAGTRRYKYDAAGNVRYSQDAVEAASGRVSFITYDVQNRPVTMGTFQLGTAGAPSTFVDLDGRIGTPATYETSQANLIQVNSYDSVPTQYPFSLINTYAFYYYASTQSNLQGRLSREARKSGGKWQFVFYSYDADGRVSRSMTLDEGFIATYGGYARGVRFVIDYTYNLQGALVRRHAERQMGYETASGQPQFNHWYNYDGVGRLAAVYASAGTIKPSSPDLTYTYNPDGTAATRQFASQTPVPFAYTVRGWLQGIGDPSGSSYPFSIRYRHDRTGEVVNADAYNGGSPASAKRFRYDYQYDGHGRLAAADYDYFANGWQSSSAYDLLGVTYDRNGNILRLRQANEAGTTIDDLTYTYTSGTNQLAALSEAAAPTTFTWDSESFTFQYDASGNATSLPRAGSVIYDERNMPVSNGASEQFRYSPGGERVFHRLPWQTSYHEVLDGSASLGSFVYNGSAAPLLVHWNLVLPSGTPFGREQGGQRVYYHTDALGSARAVVNASGTILEARDYYPFGLQMPGRVYVSGTPTREGFTGHELDQVTGMNYAGARYYMPALGRWTSTDPAGQHASPYLYGSNNPASRVDLDGMWDGDYYDDKTGKYLGSDELDDGRVYTVDRRQYSISSTALVPTFGSVSAALKPVSNYVGQASEIQDLSQEFDTEVGVLAVMASNARARVDRDNPGVGNFAAAGARFVSFVGTGSVTDLKNSASSSFSNARVATNSVGGHVFVHGRLIQPQDAGNYAYGAVSNAYNYGQATARTGAVLNQLWNGTVNGGGMRYMLSETRDQYWIGLGYNRTRLNR